MKRFGEFIKTALINGILVLFPIFASVYMLILIVRFLSDLLTPILKKLIPEVEFIGGGHAAFAILILLGVCFAIGLVTRTRIGAAIELQSRGLLNAIPSYRMFVRIARIVFDRDDASGTPVLVQRDDSRQIGFMTEEIGADEVVVFFPEPPSLISGSIEIVKASLVERLNVPAVRVARVVATYGAGTKMLLPDPVNKKDQN